MTEICERLKNMYSDKYGKDKVQLIMDSTKVWDIQVKTNNG